MEPLFSRNYTFAANVFSRCLAAIYCVAFVSFGVQVLGLIGSQGILPAARFFAAVPFWQAPSLLRFYSSDAMLQAACWIGAALAVVALLSPAHRLLQRVLFALLFVLYLSLVSAGQTFMSFQWDYLLLETGFLAIFLTPAYSRIWLFQWLLFRLMLESGMVKLLSHDPTWKNLTALSYHYETQPLPTVLAWYVAQSPLWLQKFSTLLVFGLELILPFFMFGPRLLQRVAAWGTIGLQVLILLTGNYTFFNILTIALCLFLLDDSFFRKAAQTPQKTSRYISLALIVFVAIAGGNQLLGMIGPNFTSLETLLAKTAPFGLVNTYGLFANMTTERLEITVEGSNDGETWSSYLFRYKPGKLDRAPVWVAPYQPRLDWQMWFAALGSAEQNPWFPNFLVRLLEGSPPVLRLLASDPFGGKPPKYVRARIGQYHFTSFEQRRKTGNWWSEEPRGLYFPAASLRR